MASTLHHKPLTTCIVGIGNPLRSDDGVGAYVCELIHAKQLPGVNTIITQQLDTAMIEELIGFDEVIFVDAAVNTSKINLNPITENSAVTQPLSHHINAVLFAKLAQQLYAAATQFNICAIPAANFKMGKKLSVKAKSNATKAAALLIARITSNH
jgi:hydrogenase maturation protease